MPKDYRKPLQALFIVLLLLMMAAIFSFSARNAELSTGDSDRAGIAIGRLVIPGFSQWSEEQQLAFSERISCPLRKAAHMTEYAVLALLAYGALGPGVPGGRRYHYAELIAALYAATDELHQYFVPGRSCRLFDVGIDSLGACIGLTLLFLFLRRHAARRERRSPPS